MGFSHLVDINRKTNIPDIISWTLDCRFSATIPEPHRVSLSRLRAEKNISEVHTNQTQTNITDLVEVVKEFDMLFYCFLR